MSLESKAKPHSGLDAHYFVLPKGVSSLSDIDFSRAPDATGVADALDHAKSDTPFWQGGPSNNFAARYTGALVVETAGLYTLYLTSDDGSALFLDGARVIDNDGAHATRTREATLYLEAGAHAIEVLYFEKTGKQTLQLEWQGPDSGGTRHTIGGNALAPETALAEPEAPQVEVTPEPEADETPAGFTAGLTVDYFMIAPDTARLSDIDFTATPEATAVVDGLNRVKSDAPFWDGGPTDNFAARFTGALVVETAGRYTLYLTSDDGSALFLDGARVIDNDGAHATTTRTVTLDLDAGTHPLELLYFEHSGVQTLQLEWQGPDSGGARQIIDGGALVHGAPPAEPNPDVPNVEVTPDPDMPPVDVTPDPDMPPVDVTPDPDMPHVDTTPDPDMPHVDTTPDTGSPEDGTEVTTPSHDHDHGDHIEDNPHEVGSAKHAEHAAVFDLVQHKDATHVAVRDGSWFDPDTWAGGLVPGDDARVVIASNVVVDYDGVSDARLFTVRVDGSLNVATDADTRMIVDTMVVSMKGTLTIGTADNPVQGGVRADIVIANNGDIDVAWDPQLLSRGIVSHGTVEIHGQQKTSDLKVLTDPMAGDTALTLAEAPLNWQVGDTIVIAGTRYDGYKWDNDIRATRYYEPEDEVRTITAIENDTIHLDRALEHDHDTPRADLRTSVANYSRNVTIATEDPETAAIHERGHVMFMHSDNVDVRYAAFHELGRTDKSRDALPVSVVEDMASDTNVQGRYAFHFHRTGTGDQESPAMAVGNAVFGSPGWGFVHHDSNAVLHDNATYNTFGAGFVAETGNETGSWSDNIAIHAQGVSWAAPKNGNDAGNPNFDLGRTGDGFWFQGRMVESSDNIAASVNTGFVYMHRGKGMISFDAELFDFPEALGQRGEVAPDKTPILSFRGNEAFAAKEGLHVVKANPNQGHDIHSHLQDFTAWSVRTGAHIEYTSHYLLENFDVVGKEVTPFSRSLSGISLGQNVTEVTIVNARIDGFTDGIVAKRTFTSDFDPADAGYTVIGADFRNTATLFKGIDEATEVRDADTLVLGRFEIRLDAPLTYKEGWPDPDARKVAITGTKIDSLGEVGLPAGTDNYDIKFDTVVKILETDGYFEAANGKKYFVLEAYHSDRGTGEIHKVGHLVEIDPNVPLQNPHSSYRDAVFAGHIDLDSAAPVTGDQHAQTVPGRDVVIDLLANDHDPDGDAIAVDGIVQPKHGKVFDNGDGTVTYRPDLGFTGTDAFKYWVTDGFGNFTPSVSFIEVTSDAWPDVPVRDTDASATPEAALAQSIAAYQADGRTVIEADGTSGTISAAREGSVLVGDDGFNRLRESWGDDVMYGGAGGDEFVWDLRRGGNDHDIILDLDFVEGDVLSILGASGLSWISSDSDLAAAIASDQIDARQSDSGGLEFWASHASGRILELAFYTHFDFN